eukprot:SAG31_NODE_25603_length_458_cov_0.869081_1_plen_118_part_01
MANALADAKARASVGSSKPRVAAAATSGVSLLRTKSSEERRRAAAAERVAAAAAADLATTEQELQTVGREVFGFDARPSAIGLGSTDEERSAHLVEVGAELHFVRTCFLMKFLSVCVF